ncbi:hypothetical protein CDAR_450911 [Caerostris darwini]|uniref:Reverse transcriptase N-terminal domain-containing protein n=1 Tax=Caerostris darwini TaxID=1538125 RepID=A0AAV4VCT0_9ARAC|nr:hypothetical protein CDAR_450911 [Caerostris darwini]
MSGQEILSDKINRLALQFLIKQYANNSFSPLMVNNELQLLDKDENTLKNSLQNYNCSPEHLETFAIVPRHDPSILSGKAWKKFKENISSINKVQFYNVRKIALQIIQKKVFSVRGIVAKTIIQAQKASPQLSSSYAILIALVNSKFRTVGES